MGPVGPVIVRSCASDGAGDLAAAQTTGACVGMLGGTVDDHLHTLYVGLPRAVGTSVRMAHLDAERHTLVAKFAFCHVLLHLLASYSMLYLKTAYISYQRIFQNARKIFDFFALFPSPDSLWSESEKTTRCWELRNNP